MPSRPLTHAAHLAALAALARFPDPRSDLALTREAVASLRVLPAEKEAFDGLQRALSILLRRRATQTETLRWLLSYALDPAEDFFSTVTAARGP